MEFPIKVALAQAVPTLPEGPGWWFEPKFDGHRVVLRRTDDTVILYARSGRVVTPYWMDRALADPDGVAGAVAGNAASRARNCRGCSRRWSRCRLPAPRPAAMTTGAA